MIQEKRHTLSIKTYDVKTESPYLVLADIPGRDRIAKADPKVVPDFADPVDVPDLADPGADLNLDGDTSDAD